MLRRLLILALVARTALLLVGPGILNGDGILYAISAQKIAQTGELPVPGFQSRAFSVLLAPIVWALGPEGQRRIEHGTAVRGHPIATAVHIVNVMMDSAIIALLLIVVLRQIPPPGAVWFAAFVVAQPFTAMW